MKPKTHTKVDPQAPLFVGRSKSVLLLLDCLEERRFVILQSPPSSGKTYLAENKLRATFDVVSVDVVREGWDRVYDAITHASLLGKKKLVIIDAIDKFSSHIRAKISDVAIRHKNAVLVLTNNPKVPNFKDNIVTIKMPAPSNSDMIEILHRHFPDKTIKDFAVNIPPYRNITDRIKFVRYGTVSKEIDKKYSILDIVSEVLNESDRALVYKDLLKMKPNPVTMCIYIADQYIDDRLRQYVTNYLQKYPYKIPINLFYGALAFGIEAGRVRVSWPRTTTRKKWAAKKKKPSPRKTPRKKAKKRKKPKKRKAKKMKKASPKRVVGTLSGFGGKR